MKLAFLGAWQRRCAALTVLAFTIGLASGCRNQSPAARTDQQISSDIQARIKGESALSGQKIQVSVASGVATLNGTVSDDASRALAANDSGTIPGVKTVINNLTVQPAQQAEAAPAPEPARSEASAPPPSRPRHKDRADYERPDPQQEPAPQYEPPQQQQDAQMTPAAAPPPPPAPPKPVVREITLAAGTVVPVRISETLSSKDSQPNDVFHGSLAGDLGSRGVIVIPQGAPIMGRIIDAKDATHFKGSALLSLELTQVVARGKKISLVTDAYSKEGAGRGKNTAEKAGGGAILGAIIGGIAGGGKGAAIGTLAGGAAGTGVNAATRGQQVTIPTETLINFELKSPVTVTVTIPPGQGSNMGDTPEPQLQNR